MYKSNILSYGFTVLSLFIVLNESPHSTHSYPLTLETSQPIPTDTSGYYLSDLPHPYSNALDDTVFSTASFPLSS